MWRRFIDCLQRVRKNPLILGGLSVLGLLGAGLEKFDVIERLWKEYHAPARPPAPRPGIVEVQEAPIGVQGPLGRSSQTKRKGVTGPMTVMGAPPATQVLDGGEAFLVTLNNPLDHAVVFTAAHFRIEQPGVHAHVARHHVVRKSVSTGSVQALQPEVSYRAQISCTMRAHLQRLKPPFKLAAKDAGMVKFTSPPGDYHCNVWVSFDTADGRTKEVHADRADGPPDEEAAGEHVNDRAAVHLIARARPDQR